jgi:hypothetical protein
MQKDKMKEISYSQFDSPKRIDHSVSKGYDSKSQMYQLPKERLKAIIDEIIPL